MKKSWITCLTVMTVLAILMTNFAPVAQAATKEEKKAVELAEKLEFIFEEAAVKNSSGEIVDVDIEKIEEKYGKNQDLEAIKSTLQQNESLTPTKNKNVSKTDKLSRASSSVILPYATNKCFREEMTAYANGFIPSTVIGTIYGHLYDGEYLSAARKLLKSGAKGSLVGVAGQLTTVLYKCG